MSGWKDEQWVEYVNEWKGRWMSDMSECMDHCGQVCRQMGGCRVGKFGS